MSITLSAGGATLTLPADLYWQDELSWAPVAQSVERSLTGALIIQTQARATGRPITLVPPVANASWLARATAEQLQAWANVPGLVLTLTLHGVVRQVMWRHQDGEAFTARPVMHFDDVQADDAYTPTLKLMEV